MRIKFIKILFSFLTITLFSVNGFSQTFNSSTQNRSWDSNSEINTVFLKKNGSQIDVRVAINYLKHNS